VAPCGHANNASKKLPPMHPNPLIATFNLPAMSHFIAPEFKAYLIIGIYTLICSNQVSFGEWIRIKKD